MKGLITKGIAGFYYVDTEKGLFQCKARGIFKNEGITPCVGDYVDMEITDELDDEGVINDIFPRKNIFIRPPVSNIDLFVLVISLKDPEPNTEIIDKFLVTAEQAEVKTIICINKEDLLDDEPKDIKSLLDEKANELLSIYEPLYKTIATSAKTLSGLDCLKEVMKGQKSALIGPSGVGKSTIINAIDERLNLETGDISKKTKRGKHTTKHVEIFETDFGALVFDTPGFTSFEVKNDQEDLRLDYLFLDFRPYLGKCKFADCRHIKEPGCAVRDAVNKKEIAESRYKSYLKIGEEWYD